MGINDKLDQVQGRAEQAAGDLTNDDELKAQGEQREGAGKLKDKLDDLADKAGDAIDGVKDKLKNDKA